MVEVALMHKYTQIGRTILRRYHKNAEYITKLKPFEGTPHAIPIYRVIDEEGKLIAKDQEPKVLHVDLCRCLNT